MKKVLSVLICVILSLSLSACCAPIFEERLEKEPADKVVEHKVEKVESVTEEQTDSQIITNEPVSEPTEPTTKQPSDYNMHDFYDMTINDVAEIWGYDYSLMDGLLYGGWAGIYYEDQRCPFVFCYDSDGYVPTSCSGNERLASVIAYPIASDTEFFVLEDLSVVCSYEDVSAMIAGQYNINEMEGGYSYNCEFAQNHALVFNWYENANVPSSIIISYTYID